MKRRRITRISAQCKEGRNAPNVRSSPKRFPDGFLSMIYRIQRKLITTRTEQLKGRRVVTNRRKPRRLPTEESRTKWRIGKLQMDNSDFLPMIPPTAFLTRQYFKTEWDAQANNAKPAEPFTTFLKWLYLHYLGADLSDDLRLKTKRVGSGQLMQPYQRPTIFRTKLKDPEERILSMIPPIAFLRAEFLKRKERYVPELGDIVLPPDITLKIAYLDSIKVTTNTKLQKKLTPCPKCDTPFCTLADPHPNCASQERELKVLQERERCLDLQRISDAITEDNCSEAVCAQLGKCVSGDSPPPVQEVTPRDRGIRRLLAFLPHTPALKKEFLKEMGLPLGQKTLKWLIKCPSCRIPSCTMAIRHGHCAEETRKAFVQKHLALSESWTLNTHKIYSYEGDTNLRATKLKLRFDRLRNLIEFQE